ncbi:MAG: SGNH/GDSL hydrolase family protein [bacterium]|nr:SGNH/GDSL hydrolase family protein [bacterium]
MERKEYSGIVEKGSLHRIKSLMKAANAGGEYTIGFLGGSITQGSLATTPEGCYAYLVYEWWKKKFPSAVFSFVNAGIGGTTSLYGSARAWKDLLMYQPDFVVIDFTVNDDANELFQESFEGVISQLYKAKKSPALVVLNNVCYDTGVNAQEYHNKVASYYQIPCVSMKESLYAQILDGNLVRSSITQDNLHPNDFGHGLVAEQIINLLEEAYKGLQEEEIEESVSKQSLTNNRFEHAKLYQIQNCMPLLDGFQVDTREKTGMLDLYKNGWIGKKEGDTITFQVEASSISIQYLKSVVKPRPVAEAIIDGDKEHPIRLDANFEETWGDCLYLETVINQEKKKSHELVIRIIEAHKDDKGPFYLVSIITD